MEGTSFTLILILLGGLLCMLIPIAAIALAIFLAIRGNKRKPVPQDDNTPPQPPLQ